MINIRENIWAVEVPGDENCKPSDMTFSNFYPHASKVVDEIIWIKCNGSSYGQKIIPGTWEIVCTSKEATEDDCAIIAGLSFQDVVHGYSRTLFHDQLTSKGCDLNKNWLILKKQ